MPGNWATMASGKSGALSQRAGETSSSSSSRPKGPRPLTSFGFTRSKVTPALIGSAFHAGKQGTNDARLGIVNMSQSFADVLNLVPQNYLEVLRVPLRALQELAHKSVGVSHVLDGLNAHKAKGTWPPQCIGLHEPKPELTAEFAKTSPACVTQLHDMWSATRSSVLESMIAIKTEEVQYLGGLLTPSSYLPPLWVRIHDRYNTIKEIGRTPQWGQDQNGNRVVVAYNESDSLKREFDALQIDLPHICSRIILLENSRYVAEKSKREEKRRLQAEADVEMGDVETSTKATQDVIRREVAAAFKKLSVKVSDEYRGFFIDTIDEFSDFPGLRIEAEEGKARKTRRTEGQGGDGRVVVSRWAEERFEDERETSSFEQGERKGIVRRIASAAFTYGKPNTFPDELLLIPRPLAIRILLRAADLSVVTAARFRRGVHWGPGVFQPSDKNLLNIINTCISAGARYLLPQKISRELLDDSFSDFCERLRWKLYWLTKEFEGNSELRPYDPDYEYPHERTSSGFSIEYIESGLEKGRSFLEKYQEEVVPSLRDQQQGIADNVDSKTTLKWLKDNDYLVLPTDKNLGSSIVTREWFIQGTSKLLNDPTQYSEISREEALRIFDSQRIRVESISGMAKDLLAHEQLSKYLRSNIPEDLHDYQCPRFYGIPKIHKNPVKMRPIAPCHLAMQNPAAKFASKVLKPVINHMLPYVIHGSKDMAIKLSKIKLRESKQYFLVGADIVAFYPNMDVKATIEACANYYKDSTPTPSIQERAMLRQALSVAFRDLIVQFKGKYFRQEKGIAMGVACSPDGANIFAAPFEEDFMNSDLAKTHIVFYGRFIDDLFFIVDARSPEHALEICQNLKIGYGDTPLELTWEVSRISMPFLDMSIFIAPGNKLGWRPFRKARNLLERIPYSSHHPLDVKRGTFQGEMTRLAVLCSDASLYLESLRELADVYISRGYPDVLIRKWLKENAGRRWKSRYEGGRPTSTEAGKLLLLKTVYNPVWDKFNVHAFAKVITDEWVERIVEIKRRDLRSMLEGRMLDQPLNVIDETVIHRNTNGEVVVTPSQQLLAAVGQPYGVSATGSANTGNESAANTDPWLFVWEPTVLENNWRGFDRMRYLDVSKIGLCNAKWFLSRKKPNSLMSIFNGIKRSSLDSVESFAQRIDDQVLPVGDIIDVDLDDVMDYVDG